MGSGKSNYLEDAILNHILGGPDYVRPGVIYVALLTAAPTEGGSGVEVAGNGYARVGITNNSTNWPAASSGKKSNALVIVFPTPLNPWGTITAFALFDRAVGGQMLYYGGLQPTAIAAAQTVVFPAGTLEIYEL